MTSTISPPTLDRRAAGTKATRLTGRQRRHDDRRRVLVSETFAALRGGDATRHHRPLALETARTMLARLTQR